MTLDQVRALAAVLFFLASVATMLFGAELAGAAAGAWARGSAQAGAERRRFAAARERNSGGRGLSGAWSTAKDAGGEMRSAVKDASAWARQEGGPVRRVAAAGAAGAYTGAKGTARAAAGARRKAAASRAAAKAAGGTGRAGSKRPGGRGGAGADGKRAGWHPRKLGVCDMCGVTASRASIKPVTGPGGREHRVCVTCRRRQGAWTATVSRPARDGARERTPVPGQAGGSPTGPAAVSPPPGQLPGEATAVLAAATQSPSALAEGTVGAVTPGNQQAITGGTPAMTTARYGAIGSGAAAGTAVAARAAGSVAMQEGTTHGAQDEVAQDVITATGRVRAAVAASVEYLSAENASESQIRDMAGWADSWWKAMSEIEAGQAADNARLDQYVESVRVAGGPSEVADPAYASDY